MKTLVISPHFDDEAISCGGLIQNRVAAGGQVFVAAIHGRYYGRVTAREQMLSDDREHDDFLVALSKLGAKGGGMMHLEGEPYSHGFYDLLEPIEDLIQNQRPDEVIIPSAEDLNQDHRHLNYLCRIALRPIRLGRVKKVLEFHALDGRLRQPTYFVPLTRGKLDVKLDAIKCYRRERRGLPSPRAPENVEAQARVWGAACGVEFAEGYTVFLERSECELL